jgi:hypothetical protein
MSGHATARVPARHDERFIRAQPDQIDRSGARASRLRAPRGSFPIEDEPVEFRQQVLTV